LRYPLTPGQVEQINDEFADLLEQGSFEGRTDPLPEELDEPAIKDLPRLVFPSNRKSASRLRQLIDHLNSLPVPSSALAEMAQPIPPAGL
jgi:hypothetical protein